MEYDVGEKKSVIDYLLFSSGLVVGKIVIEDWEE